MREDNCQKVSPSQSDASTTKQRKKRKWDQPDESLISTGVAVPGIFPLANVGSLARITLPIVSPISSASLAIMCSASGATPFQVIQVPLQQHAAAIVQNLVQSRIQDELIAREIVINDADSAIRCKLTKRQTQEEIQKCTGAVVITRGKYQPPNAPPHVERPLYLHISAVAHLETMAERIKAVDHAAAMVEEMLKQGPLTNGVKADHLFNTSIFLGFEADPSFNIVSRIRGPNDQYVNHIMNVTGANVSLRGGGSENFQNEQTEESQQPLRLLLSSNDPKSLEHAKLLAENLLDTISAECGASRNFPSKAYSAVPPPPQLQAGLENSSKAHDIAPEFTFIPPPPGPICHSTASYPHVNGTSYIGYGGIYPQATPLQQVALALRQSTSPVTATVAPITTAGSTAPATEEPSRKDKRPQKRKFQELPAANPKQKNLQGSEFPMPRELTSHVGDISSVKAPKKQSFNEMPPPPPPPPKIDSNLKLQKDNSALHKSKPEVVPDTLIKLMEYGDDDDDLE